MDFAVTHESCNKSKQDANLKIAKILEKLSQIQKSVHTQTGKSASLKDVLNRYSGSKHEFKSVAIMERQINGKHNIFWKEEL